MTPNNNLTPERLAALKAAVEDYEKRRDQHEKVRKGIKLANHAPTIRALLEDRERLIADLRAAWPDPDAEDPPMAEADRAEMEAEHQSWLAARQAKYDEAKAAGAREAYKVVREAIDTCEVHKPMDDSWAPVHRRAVAMMRSILDAVENPGPVTDAREREAQS